MAQTILPDEIEICDDASADNTVEIAEGCIVGAGSVVTHDIPSNCVYAGNPAKYICSFDEFRERHIQNRMDHGYFQEYKWNEWSNASNEKRQAMKEKLEDTFGYV